MDASVFAARRGLTLVTCAGGLLLLCAGRLVQLELRDGPTLRERARQQQQAWVPVPAQRGDILDANGRVIAGSVRRPGIYADPAMIEDPAATARVVAPVLGLDADELARELLARRTGRFAWVKREVTEEELAAFDRLRRSEHLSGLVVAYAPRRQYPHGRLASHTIGFVGVDQHGLAGIEQCFDEALAGQDGRRACTVDNRRRPIEAQAADYRPPRDGASVVLTIDAHIQERTETHLRTAVEEFKALWGTAVVMDPQSGEVLAMATYPDFPPEAPIPGAARGAAVRAAQERLTNRAVSGAYEPGSVYKPFIIACALQDGLVQFGESFRIDGPIRQFGRRSIHDTHAYGTLCLEEIISKSSNIGAGLIGERAGNPRLYEYVRRFGFGDPTGIMLPGEHAGLVQDLRRWNDYSDQSVPIGQEVAITPLQLVTAFCAFCNDGILFRPRIVRGLVSAEGGVVEDWSRPLAVRRVLRADVAREFRLRALVEVVRSGTGKNAAIAGYQVFGKTGTAQIARGDGRGYVPNAYIGSFVGGAPSDQPRVAALVSIFMPSGGKYYGGTVAAPAVGRILADALAYMQVPEEAGVQAARLTSAPDTAE